jgi:hypothetical protein
VFHGSDWILDTKTQAESTAIAGAFPDASCRGASRLAYIEVYHRKIAEIRKFCPAGLA